MPELPPLPVDAALPPLLEALETQGRAVLTAPPGAGKTTKVPLALLDAPWRGEGTILMLEPRRLAARASARRMAALLGETPGETVGWRTRLDRAVGPGTRVEVITEGLLTRRLLADPALPGVAAVILDEFHERSLAADQALALLLEARAVLRPDLRLLVMSATLEAARVAALLDDAPLIDSPGRAFPVETRHLDPGPGRLEPALASAIADLMESEPGSLLAFLPGAAEIRRTEAALTDLAKRRRLPPEVDIRPLYGALSPAAQDAAIAPPPAGRRKIVLATSIAETSLTIEGVRLVVDAGLARRPAFDPASGLTRLVTVPVSRAAADQRRGRAGRTEPGLCLRLWPAARDGARPAFDPPEMAEADLAPLALDLALWGTPAEDLAWLDPPPPGALAAARDLLTELGALDSQGRPTTHGRALGGWPLHPRLAHMVVGAREMNAEGLACLLAALLEERDPPPGGPADITRRLALLRDNHPSAQAIQATARPWLKRLKAKVDWGQMELAGRLLALAYPDRIARRRPGGTDGPARWLLSGGKGARLAEGDPLETHDWLVAANLEGGSGDVRIRLAAPLSRADAEALAPPDETPVIAWDAAKGAVTAHRERRLGAIVLGRRPLPDPDPEAVRAAFLDGLRSAGLKALPWSKSASHLRDRLAFLAAHQPEAGWPDVSDGALLDSLEDWLGPFLPAQARALADLAGLDLAAALKARVGWPLAGDVDAQAPPHVTLPTGREARLDYPPEGPTLAVKLQEMFGAAQGPALLDGRVPVRLALLSPAGRPLQVTTDLAGFWKGSYAQVRGEMRGRYPKHPWPENPATAAPTRRTKGALPRPRPEQS
ncbi:ATP-dependent helicase HrpB [Roseospirillum parvum]|uniref:ATP-dependent helicase HrpB n=1 Tax=Roseospirillum parvum TaxID=83401 RepID=A0A1G8FHF9_9PROT|nr:ATP-dependent helicase HrpB [Roseospirillum parvum]SDH81583.1 ATP-dependent helicase HrpB [Roseospirillum parvum]